MSAVPTVGRRFALVAPERVVADGVCFGDSSVIRSRSTLSVTVYRQGARYLPDAMTKSLYWIDNPDKEPYDQQQHPSRNR